MVSQLGCKPCLHDLNDDVILPMCDSGRIIKAKRYKEFEPQKNAYVSNVSRHKELQAKRKKRAVDPRFIRYEPSNEKSHSTRASALFKHDAYKDCNPNAQIWALTSKGVLKAINLDARTAHHYCQTAQPSREENFFAMCSPMRNSLIGVNKGGGLYKIKNGVFYQLGNSPNRKNAEPIFMDQLPSYYEHKLYLYPEAEPSLKSNQLIIVNSDCSISYNNHWVNSFNIHQSDSSEKKVAQTVRKAVTAACINQDSVSTGGNGLYPCRKDIETGLMTWECERTVCNWWSESSIDDVKYMLTDKTSETTIANCFFCSYNKGFVRLFDVRAKTKGGPVLEVNTNNFPKKNNNPWGESFLKMFQIKTAPHQLIASSNKSSICVLDTRKFVTHEQLKDTYVQDTNKNFCAGADSVVKNYNFKEHKQTHILSTSFLGPTRTRPGLIATGSNDGMLRVYDAKTSKLKEMIYLRDSIIELILVPGISCFQDRSEDHPPGRTQTSSSRIKDRSQTSVLAGRKRVASASDEVTGDSIGETSESPTSRKIKVGETLADVKQADILSNLLDEDDGQDEDDREKDVDES